MSEGNKRSDIGKLGPVVQLIGCFDREIISHVWLQIPDYDALIGSVLAEGGRPVGPGGLLPVILSDVGGGIANVILSRSTDVAIIAGGVQEMITQIDQASAIGMDNITINKP